MIKTFFIYCDKFEKLIFNYKKIMIIIYKKLFFKWLIIIKNVIKQDIKFILIIIQVFQIYLIKNLEKIYNSLKKIIKIQIINISKIWKIF